ncbi:hypothetical protein PGB90_005067 [Kerria lacca]
MKKKLKKKSQKKQKKQQKEEKNVLPEVNKELYEIQISDLNSKLKRLKEEYGELEKEHLKTKNDLDRVNEDRSDVIVYLEQILKSKVEEMDELQDRFDALRQLREKENSEFLSKLTDKEVELKKTREQLNTEINLLNGKLNVLDEFRVQKENLVEKFQSQEEAQKQQELRHQETLHSVEKDFILKKIHMKKEVEEKLIKLSEDFQKMLQSKIDSTTKITIAENNSLKTEMNKLMDTSKELIKENNALKEKDYQMKIKNSTLKGELEENIRKYIRQNKKLNEIMAENKELKNISSNVNIDFYVKEIQNLSKNLNNYKINLEKQIYINEELKKSILLYQQKENILNEKLRIKSDRVENIENVIKNAVHVIKDTFVTDSQKREINFNRNIFVSSLVDILKCAKIEENDILMNKNIWFP